MTNIATNIGYGLAKDYIREKPLDFKRYLANVITLSKNPRMMNAFFKDKMKRPLKKEGGLDFDAMRSRLEVFHAIHVLKAHSNRNRDDPLSTFQQYIIAFHQNSSLAHTFLRAAGAFQGTISTFQAGRNNLLTIITIAALSEQGIQVEVRRVYAMMTFMAELREKLGSGSRTVSEHIDAAEKAAQLLKSGGHSMMGHMLIDHNRTKWWLGPFRLETSPIEIR
jgi:hypothetical protein